MIYKNKLFYLIFIIAILINIINCNNDNGTGGKLINNNNNNNIIEIDSINIEESDKNNNNNNNNNKIIEKEINIEEYKKIIILNKNDIEKQELVDDFNGDIVSSNCFNIDTIKIEEVVEENEEINKYQEEEQEEDYKKKNKLNILFNKIKISNEIKENIINNLDWTYLDGSWRCVDSFKSNSYTNFNTFGGSIGEFIISFHIFQDQTNQRIDDDQKLIYEIMKKFLKHNREVYLIYHSSEEIHEKLVKTIKNNLDYYNNGEGEFDILNVRKEDQSYVLRLLKNHEFIGCQFIKQLILGDHSGTLNSISPILVKNVLDSFFNILWNEKSEISNILYEIDDHNEMVSIVEVNVNPIFTCKKNRYALPKLDQKLNHNNAESHKSFYIVQDDEIIRLGLRDKISKYFYDELLCDEHHLEQHRKKDLLSFSDFKEYSNYKALIFRESCLKNIKKGYEPHYIIQFNIKLTTQKKPLFISSSPKKNNNSKTNIKSNNNNHDDEIGPNSFNRNNNYIYNYQHIKNNSPFNSQQLNDVKGLLQNENLSNQSNNDQLESNSSIKTFFSGLFVIFIVVMVGSTLIFGYVSYKRRNEKYKSHKRLENVFNLEDDIEDEFDL